MPPAPPQDAAGAGRPAPAKPRRVIVASNRGPIAFTRDDDGELVAQRGAGGLVTALTGALQVCGGMWVASAMSEEDREQARRGVLHLVSEEQGYDVRYLPFDDDEYDLFYNEVSNRILWFVHHILWDIPRSPRFDSGTRAAWEAFRRVNESFAAALDEEGRDASGAAAYLVQDYHLSLVPALLRARRPDAPIAYFSHIPFAGPNYFPVLPEDIRGELLRGLLGADVIGFHTRRWAENFLQNCQHLDGAKVDMRRSRVRWQGRDVWVRTYPISVDVDALRAESEGADAVAARRELSRVKGDGKLIVRVDRADLSKNILRGFLAFEAFLERYPAWRRKVRFFAQINPSREEVPEYAEYLEDCVEAAKGVNQRLGEPGWEPIEICLKDDVPMSLAAYRAYDALLVNPIFDGMNLVAKEGVSLNRTNGVLILSENAGAFAELGPHALRVNPFDIEATAEAINTALEMDEDERIVRARRLRAAVRRSRLDRWVEAQITDLEGAAAARG